MSKWGLPRCICLYVLKFCGKYECTCATKKQSFRGFWTLSHMFFDTLLHPNFSNHFQIHFGFYWNFFSFSFGYMLIINKGTNLVTRKNIQKGFLFRQMIRVNRHRVARRWIVKQINLRLSFAVCTQEKMRLKVLNNYICSRDPCPLSKEFHFI